MCSDAYGYDHLNCDHSDNHLGNLRIKAVPDNRALSGSVGGLITQENWRAADAHFNDGVNVNAQGLATAHVVGP